MTDRLMVRGRRRWVIAPCAAARAQAPTPNWRRQTGGRMPGVPAADSRVILGQVDPMARAGLSAVAVSVARIVRAGGAHHRRVRRVMRMAVGAATTPSPAGSCRPRSGIEIERRVAGRRWQRQTGQGTVKPGADPQTPAGQRTGADRGRSGCRSPAQRHRPCPDRRRRTAAGAARKWRLTARNRSRP